MGGVSAFGAAAAACAPGTGGPGSSSSAPVTMEIWHPWDGTREPFFKQVVADYQKIHPHVTINASVTPYDVLAEKYPAAAAAGTAPPMAYLERQDFLAYALKKIIEPLDTLVKQAKISPAEYYESDIKNATYDINQWHDGKYAPIQP